MLALPYVVICTLISLQQITPMSDLLPCAWNRQTVLNIWNLHIPWATNSDKIIAASTKQKGRATKRLNTHFILPNKKTLNTGTKKKNHPLIQLSFLEEGTWGAAISMRPVSSPWWSRAPRSSQQPSVQELQGALSLGNRIIIKQVTSGTCFSPRTSGKDNCVSVNDGWVFAGLAAGPCARCDWLAGAGRSLSAHFSWP